MGLVCEKKALVFLQEKLSFLSVSVGIAPKLSAKLKFNLFSPYVASCGSLASINSSPSSAI